MNRPRRVVVISRIVIHSCEERVVASRVESVVCNIFEVCRVTGPTKPNAVRIAVRCCTGECPFHLPQVAAVVLAADCEPLAIAIIECDRTVCRIITVCFRIRVGYAHGDADCLVRSDARINRDRSRVVSRSES